MPFRIEVNVKTGAVESIPLTQAELDKSAIAAAEEAVTPKGKTLEERVTALEAAAGLK